MLKRRGVATHWMRQVRPFSLVLFVGLFVAAISPARADAYPTTCAYASGSYSSNETRSLTYTMTFKSIWASNWTYNARRIRSDGSVAYHAYVETQDSVRTWVFENSIDVYRSTTIQRGGYGNANYSMEQQAEGSC